MSASGASREAQEAFLRAFHDRQPGVTTRAYAAGRGADGRSSYEVLADVCAPGDRVLDLGAGDGWLVDVVVQRRGVRAARIAAVEVSLGELHACAARVPEVAAVCARAQALPFADATFDVVLSHLAFTLMADVDDVVREVARVLRPGGSFAAIVGGGPKGDDAFAGFLELARPWLARAAATGGAVPRLGDRRARTDAGLAALFAVARGWAALTVDDVAVDLSGVPDDVLARMMTAYEVAALGEDERAMLREAFVAEAPRWRREDGAIACTMFTRLVVATRS